ncbi:uncharacterized protein LOC126456701 [Schistocerca serialis cubense]|uniref:uncharacterized protein LOC126456701 n=1 Tax=Schistocerca serialis cubense TaxID=2023355 RepID=UPI00214F36B6|nr:uncharacterized protein LOC126456701 [Schistocerca serialis cubense]
MGSRPLRRDQSGRNQRGGRVSVTADAQSARRCPKVKGRRRQVGAERAGSIKRGGGGRAGPAVFWARARVSAAMCWRAAPAAAPAAAAAAAPGQINTATVAHPPAAAAGGRLSPGRYQTQRRGAPKTLPASEAAEAAAAAAVAVPPAGARPLPAGRWH